MQQYELTVLVHPDLEGEIDKTTAAIKELVESADGKILKEDNWGKKKLAYQIRREDFAVYVYMEVNLPADAPLKISNTLNITDEVLRYLLVKADDKMRQALAEQKEREAKNEAESSQD